jgi:predicted O-methyltransferase YrrM
MNHKEAFLIRSLASQFWSSRILLTANNFRIFDYLEKPLSARRLAEKLSLDRRATEICLDALTALNLLRKKSDRYVNTSASSKYLVSGKPFYQGDILRHNEILWANWSGLDEIVQVGKPKRRAQDHRSFILGMHNISSLKSREVLKHLSLKGVQRILDLGGGPGTYAIALAKKRKDVTLFDTPETVPIARDLIEEAGLGDRVRLIAGDFTVDSIGSGYDLVFISHILHMLNARENMKLLRKVKGSMNPGGRVVVHDFYLRSNRTEPLMGALFSINMLVHTSSGRSYTVNEISGWLKRVGLKVSKKQRLDETVLIQAQK